MNIDPIEKPAPSPYSGMTPNERLFAAGMLDAWDAAANARDRTRMIQLLMATDVLGPAAEKTVDAVLAHPERYGY